MKENKTMLRIARPFMLIGGILVLISVFVYGNEGTISNVLFTLGLILGLIGVYLADKSGVKTLLYVESKKEFRKKTLIAGFFMGFLIGMFLGMGVISGIISGIVVALIFYGGFSLLYRKKLKKL